MGVSFSAFRATPHTLHCYWGEGGAVQSAWRAVSLCRRRGTGGGGEEATGGSESGCLYLLGRGGSHHVDYKCGQVSYNSDN